MRRSATAHNPGVSLFPFLAVLICTMGVMMLLLVICNRPGVEGDDKAAGATVAESDADAAKGVLSWRVAQLKSARDKTETDLADRRLRLSAVEEHMGQLREEWNALRLAAKDLELAEHAKGEAEHLTEAQLAQLRQQLEQAKGDLGKAVERRRTEAPSFAIVPYEGPNGTRRRPIYIECSRDRVTIQPEGVVLTIEDFEGPSGPGNPLATILRAMRDYLAAQGAAGGAASEPYPLLLVRPDGIQLFYGARAAMESWASEFGYELIEQDRKLAYPAPNPRLAQVEQVALADARAATPGSHRRERRGNEPRGNDRSIGPRRPVAELSASITDPTIAARDQDSGSKGRMLEVRTRDKRAGRRRGTRASGSPEVQPPEVRVRELAGRGRMSGGRDRGPAGKEHRPALRVQELAVRARELEVKGRGSGGRDRN